MVREQTDNDDDEDDFLAPVVQRFAKASNSIPSVFSRHSNLLAMLEAGYIEREREREREREADLPAEM